MDAEDEIAIAQREEGVKLAEEETKIINQRKLTYEKVSDIILYNYPGISFDKVTRNGRFILVIPKKNDISRVCPISMRQHNSNNVWFYADTFINKVEVRCFKCTGSVELTKGEKRLYSDISSDITVSNKAKKSRSSTSLILPPIHGVHPIQFSHNYIKLSPSDIFDLYESLNFAYVKAMKTQKRPVLKGWTNSTSKDNLRFDINDNNLAIVTGKSSGICVLDIDVKDNGLEWFKNFCSSKQFNYCTYTMAVETPSGGVHIYFKYSDRLDVNRVKMKDSEGKTIGIDIRSNDGCVIAPPSLYNAGEYKFICVTPPRDIPDIFKDIFI